MKLSINPVKVLFQEKKNQSFAKDLKKNSAGGQSGSTGHRPEEKGKKFA